MPTWIDYWPLTAAVLVSPEVLSAALASCCGSSHVLDNLESNRSTCRICHKNTVSLQCEPAGELSNNQLWSSFYHRLSRDEAAHRCESGDACWGGRTVKMPSHTGHSGSSSLPCASTRVFSTNLKWRSSFRTLNRGKETLQCGHAYAVWNSIGFWTSWYSQNMRKAFCDSPCASPADVSEGSPSHTLHTHELSQQTLQADSSL